MLKMRFLWLFIVLGSTGLTVAGQAPIVIYNPSGQLPESVGSDSDDALVKEKLVPGSSKRWAGDEACNGGNMSVIGAVDGSFTRTGSKQRAIVYELCQTGNGLANNGLAIIEGGRIVAHFTEEGGWNLEVSRVPDVNRDGRDELAIETGGGMHQGYTGSSVTILEVGTSAITELGSFLVNTNSCENYAPNKYCDRSYKLTAKASLKPAFFTQKFLNRGTDEKPRWVAAGKPLPAKRIGTAENTYEAVK